MKPFLDPEQRTGTWWTANFGRGVSPERFTDDLVDLLRRDGGQGILLLQEIDEADTPDEHAILKTVARERYAIANYATAVPILVSRTRFNLVSSKVTPACAGLAGVTPHRVISEAVVEFYGAPELPRIATLNTHLPLLKPSTITRRRNVRRAMRQRAHHYRNLGYMVVIGMDSNTSGHFPTMLRRERVGVRRGIDFITYRVARGTRVKKVGELFDDLHIDGHDAHAVSLRVTDRPGRPAPVKRRKRSKKKG